MCIFNKKTQKDIEVLSNKIDSVIKNQEETNNLIIQRINHLYDGMKICFEKNYREHDDLRQTIVSLHKEVLQILDKL